MGHSLERLRTVAEHAARAAGMILRQMQDSVNAREKAPADLVTEADVAAQREIRAILLQATPEFGFVGEESDKGQIGTDSTAEYCWVVDPLDGTTNYVHGLDSYCVSVALRRGQKPVLGVVLDPVRDELYWAIEGRGAFLNGRPLQTSARERLDESLMAASFAARVPRNSPEIGRFVEVLHRCRAVRRLGSAALNLCYVAAGRLDGYWATSVKAWDVAAGVLCVTEAGGCVTAMDGGPFRLQHPTLIAAATLPLHAELFSVLSQFPD